MNKSETYQQQKKNILESTTQEATDMIKSFELKVNKLNFILVQVQLGPYKVILIIIIIFII